MPTAIRTNGTGPSDRRRKGPRVLIAGLGNLLLKDDGVGVHAVRELRRQMGKDALAVEVGTAVLDALHLIESADRVLAIDAMQAGGGPGTIYSFGVEDAERRPVETSLHELTFLSALELARKRPREIVVLGVEPETIAYGLELTPKVACALPKLVEAAKRIVSEWRQGSGAASAAC